MLLKNFCSLVSLNKTFIDGDIVGMSCSEQKKDGCCYFWEELSVNPFQCLEFLQNLGITKSYSYYNIILCCFRSVSYFFPCTIYVFTLILKYIMFWSDTDHFHRFREPLKASKLRRTIKDWSGTESSRVLLPFWTVNIVPAKFFDDQLWLKWIYRTFSYNMNFDFRVNTRAWLTSISVPTISFYQANFKSCYESPRCK